MKDSCPWEDADPTWSLIGTYIKEKRWWPASEKQHRESAVSIQIHLWRARRSGGGNLGAVRTESFDSKAAKGPGNHFIQCSQCIGLKGISDFTKDTQMVNDRVGIRNLSSLLLIQCRFPQTTLLLPKMPNTGFGLMSLWCWTAGFTHCRHQTDTQLKAPAISPWVKVIFLCPRIMLYLRSFKTGSTQRLDSGFSCCCWEN